MSCAAMNEEFGRLMYRIGTGAATVHDAEALAKLMPRWITLDEAMPEPLIDVLVVWSASLYDDEPAIDIALRLQDGTWALTGTDPLIVIAPTHWMPLPALPVGVSS